MQELATRAPAFRTVEEIEELVDAFESCALPRAQWNHAAHLTVAVWYLTHHGEPKATQRMRAAIQKYNRAQGISMSESGGYHETLTLFYMRVLHRYLGRLKSGGSTVEAANQVVIRFSSRRYPLNFYSKELLMSVKARAEWVEPDLKPLD